MSVKIFIVDDSVVARTMLTNILATNSDYEIVGEASTGQGGIIMLEETQPDIVMLEANIGGGMSVQDVIKEMKKLMPETKIVICSDPNQSKLIIPASEVGADDFVEKPYRKTRIFRVINELMGGK